MEITVWTFSLESHDKASLEFSPHIICLLDGKKMKVESSIAAFTNENGVHFSRNKSSLCKIESRNASVQEFDFFTMEKQVKISL